MDVKTFRARSMQEALAMVRRELGPSAAVLHTRETRTGKLLGWIGGSRRVEVMASADVRVPSRLPPRPAPVLDAAISEAQTGTGNTGAVDAMQDRLDELQAMVESLSRRTRDARHGDLRPELFNLYTALIDAEIDDHQARDLVEMFDDASPGANTHDLYAARRSVARLLADEIPIAGPIQLEAGRRRVVALVGPTGVGKTTTVAKLAANFRLREKLRVGLITVDTYRVAAVEQLRTYADIIDLPMQVVSTPREMREAVHRMEDANLLLIDTAGRSPRDEVKIQELKAFLSEARADDVHLVLSSVADPKSLVRTAERFAAVGTSALILTKLDEATALGNVLPLARGARQPLSYVTNGQNVPDDIRPADALQMAHAIVGVDNELVT